MIFFAGDLKRKVLMETPYAFHSKPLKLLKSQGKIVSVRPAPEGEDPKAVARSPFPADVSRTQYHVIKKRGGRKDFSNARRIDFASKTQASIKSMCQKKAA